LVGKGVGLRVGYSLSKVSDTDSPVTSHLQLVASVVVKLPSETAVSKEVVIELSNSEAVAYVVSSNSIFT
jgi:hypothetical protein